jgi:hypothetical protein
MGNYLGKNSRSLRRRERRPFCTHTAAPDLGPRAVTPGVAANSGPSIDVSSTANCAASTGRVPGLGGVSSSPVHRAFVLVLGTNIAVLLDCSKSSRQCSLPSFLTYLCDQVRRRRRVSKHIRRSNSKYLTFVTLECVRARVWLLPSLRSVEACVWPWLPERVVVVHIPCVLTYLLTYRGRSRLLLLLLQVIRENSASRAPKHRQRFL